MQVNSKKIIILAIIFALIVISIYFFAQKNELLKLGSESKNVGKLQEKLNEKGYNLVVDNIFGAKTEKALLTEFGKNEIYTSEIRKI